MKKALKIAQPRTTKVYREQRIVARHVACQSKGHLRAVESVFDSNWRICYVANGRWQLERYWHGGLRDDDGLLSCAAWHAYQRPTDYLTAKEQLDKRGFAARLQQA